MLTKVFYFGLGLADVFLEIFNHLVEKGENRFSGKVPGPARTDDGSLVFVQGKSAPKEMDDLTIIKGIGPTFASRLEDAGVDSYRKLADLSPDELKEITHVADWQGDPREWINQAKAFANSN